MSPIKYVNPLNDGNIFFISSEFLKVLTLNTHKINYKKDLSNLIFIDNTKSDYYIRVAIIGSNGVGKSCFIEKVLNNKFSEKDGKNKEDINKYYIQIGSIKLRLELKELEKVFLPLISKGMFIIFIIFIYSIDSEQSFSYIKQCLQYINQRNPSKPTKIFLIGNKKDLHKDRKIMKIEAKEFAKNNGIYWFDEISVKTDNYNDLREILLEISKLVYKYKIK